MPAARKVQSHHGYRPCRPAATVKLGRALPLRAWNDEDRDALKDFMDRSGGPHAIIWTHADEVNQALLDFIGHPGRVGRSHGGPENRPQSRSHNGRAV
jgi:hypothetical protein